MTERRWSRMLEIKSLDCGASRRSAPWTTKPFPPHGLKSVNIGRRLGGRDLVKSEQQHSRQGESDPLRWLRYAGAVAAFLAVLGLAIMVFWYVLRAPRF